MLTHVVMWTLKRPEDATTFVAELTSCRDLVPGQRDFDIGARTTGFEATADVVLVAVFDDKAALDAYAVHPHHKAVVGRIAPFAATRAVLDFHNDTGRIDVPSGDA